MTGYELSRRWFDLSFETQAVTANDTALFFWIVEKANRCGWPSVLSITATECQAACNFASYNTYKKSYDTLVAIGVITVVYASKNQYSTNKISIALSNFDKANDKAIDYANEMHVTKQSRKQIKSTIESKVESKCDISKTNKQETNNLKPQNLKDNSGEKNAAPPLEDSDFSPMDSINAEELKTINPEAEIKSPPVAPPPLNINATRCKR